MGKQTGGFTIIETMLFLGISGILIVGLLAGTGVTIGIQRYRDSVETFKSFLQGQYSELSSVRNDRDKGWTCDQNAATSETASPGDGIDPGQSECMFVGRYVSITDDQVVVYSVTARKITNPANLLATDTAIDKIAKKYNFNIASGTKEESTLEWGARIAWPQAGKDAKSAGTPRSITFLFLRSPDTGETYTFNSSSAPGTVTPATLRAMIVNGLNDPGQGDRTLCIDSNGSTLGADQSVYIYAAASGPSSIETRSDDYIDGLDGRVDGIASVTCQV